MHYQSLLTDRQCAVVDEYKRRLREGLPPPTHRELCQVFGWRAPGTARDCLNALIQKKVLVRTKGKARGVRLANPHSGFATVPLLGEIVAGHPVSAEQLSGEAVSVPASWAKPNTFALHVYGNSMKDAGILEGDTVVVREPSEAAPGDIVAATVEGETTLKRLTKDAHGRLWLTPENPEHDAMRIRTPTARIHGVVVGLLRNYTAMRLKGAR